MKTPFHLHKFTVLLLSAAFFTVTADAQQPVFPKPELAILRETDPQFPVLDGKGGGKGQKKEEHGKKRDQEKDRREHGKKDDQKDKKRADDRKGDGKDKEKKSAPVANKDDGKKAPAAEGQGRKYPNSKATQAEGKSDCPDCKKSEGSCPKCKGGNKPPVAKNDRAPHGPLNDIHTQRREMMRKRFEEMRRHYEEPRKHFGQNRMPQNRGKAQRPPLQQGRPQQPRPPQQFSQNQRPSQNHDRHPEIGKLQQELEKTTAELERTRNSLSMAHKELGDKSLTIKKLEDQVNNFRSQLARTEKAVKSAHQMVDEHKKMAATVDELRKQNAALQNDVNVVRKKAAEAVSKVQGDAKRFVEAQQQAVRRAMEEREKARKPSESAPPSGNSGVSRRPAPPKKASPDVKSRPPARSPKKPEPNKPSKPEAQKISIAPIEFGPKSAVNYEERDRVLAEAKALLEKSPDAKLKIIGHSDDTEYDQVNQDISANRAKFLASYLRVNGIETEITHKGIGNSAPEKKAAHNRRVVIEIVK